MALLVITILVIIVIITSFESNLQVKRQVLFNDLQIAYDKMELTLIKKHIHPNTSTVEFLKSYKFLLVNKNLADIKIMLCMLIAVSDQKRIEGQKAFDEIKQNVDPDLIVCANEFVKIYDKIITNSIFSLSFWMFLGKLVLYAKYLKLMHHGKRRVTNIKRNFKEVFHAENLITAAYKLSA